MTTRFGIGRAGLFAVAGSALVVALAAPVSAQCVGDCNGSGSVEINELIIGVNIALGSLPISSCPSFDCEGTGMVPINCLIQGVNNALGSCPGGPTNTPTLPGGPTNTPTLPVGPTNTPTLPVGPTNTPTSPGATATPTVGQPTPTSTMEPGCPIAAGAYTTTQMAGGKLKVYTFRPFDFPAGGAIVQDVHAATLPDCVHDTVIPFPGGFSAPNFCVPALGYTVSVTQTGCGVGQIDSNGGSDFTVKEIIDTSDSSATCNLPQMGCPPGPPVFGSDGSTRVDITVGDGTADTCTSGTANAIVTVPVHTVTWQDNSTSVCHGGTNDGAECADNDACPPGPPDAYCGFGGAGGCKGDGVFNDGDAIITQFDQILDFTTDTTKSNWADIDGDGCSLAGGGPFAGQPAITGSCLDLASGAVTTVASGGFGSTGVPNDGSFSTTLPNIVTGPAAPLGATCDAPPAINFTGEATRCIH